MSQRHQHYQQAPISEVVFGLSFSEPLLNMHSDVLQAIGSDFFRGYHVEYDGPVADVQLSAHHANAIINHHKQGKIRIKLTNSEAARIYQFQQDKYFFSWFRKDEQQIGHYPGFSTLLDEFLLSVTRVLKDMLGLSTEEMHNKMLRMSLLYQDRFHVNQYLGTEKLSDMFAFSLPSLSTNSASLSPSTASGSHLYELENGNAFARLNYSTDPRGKASPDSEDLFFAYQLELSGTPDSDEENAMKNWLDAMHTYQIQMFEAFFSDNLKQQWK